MELNDLLQKKAIDPRQVLVLRHRPYEPELSKVLPWLAAEKPDVFNAYQQTQGEKLEKVMANDAGYVASFIGCEAGKAVFVGLYSIGASRPITVEEYWRVPAHIELKRFGMKGFTEERGRPSCLWFDLALTDFYVPWKGKLIVTWPPPERSWWRRAHRNSFPIFAVLEDNALVADMPEWERIVFKWDELSILPTRWRSALKEWRGIYYIYDESDGKGYVGSAFGDENLLGRWLSYAKSGHGGNVLLRKRDPQRFRFSILQRVSPDMAVAEITRLESAWKERLHTNAPLGLNDN